MPQTPTLANWLSILSLGVIWGGTFMIMSIALQDYGAVTVATARTTLGALALLVPMILLGRGFPAWDAKLWGFIIAAGVLSTALPFFLLSWGQQHVPSAFAGLSMAAIPLFVLPLAHVFVPGEQLSRRRTLGFGLGFLGAAVLIGPGILEAGKGNLEALGRLSCIAAALSYAIASILTRRCPPVDPVALAALTLVVGSVVLLPAMFIVDGMPVWSGGQTGAALIFLGLVPTGLAVFLRTSVIRSAGPGFMTLVNYQVPVWSMLFGALVLNEALPGRFFIALALILTGLGISHWRRKRPPPE
ncbi:MAG: DMT family transporter [Rhodobacteraceae bacterium]|nr:DMT family transporter [Paracoccaceae bacterium]